VEEQVLQALRQLGLAATEWDVRQMIEAVDEGGAVAALSANVLILLTLLYVLCCYTSAKTDAGGGMQVQKLRQMEQVLKAGGLGLKERDKQVLSLLALLAQKYKY
jgi:hypothetical protein